MNDAKFTKGEWVIDERHGEISIEANHNEEGFFDLICEGINEDDKANAHLIVAAPEMYKQVESLVDILFELRNDPEVLNVWKCHFDQGHIDEALKVLAKARGE